METRSLEYFAMLYEHPSINQAADRLYISHQGLSKAIAHLEKDLGQRLFIRTNQGITPTPFARTIYPQVRSILEHVRQIEQAAHGQTAGGLVRISSTAGYLSFVGEELRRHVRMTTGGIEYDIVETTDERASQLVLEGTTACGCVAEPVDSTKFDAEPLTRHPFIVAVNENDPLAHRNTIDYCDLNGYTVVTMGDGYAPRNYVRNRLLKAGCKPLRFVDVAEVSSGLYYVRRGDGVHITADFAAIANLGTGICIKPFSDTSFTWDVSFITRKGSTLSHETKLLRMSLKDGLPHCFTELGYHVCS